MFGRTLPLVLILSSSLAAQGPEYRVPATVFLGTGDVNSVTSESVTLVPQHLTVGTGDDIWLAGVAKGDTLPGTDAEDHAFEAARCVVPTGIGGPFPVAQQTCTDGFLTRLGSEGFEILFARYFGAPGMDYVSDLAVGGDGSAYVVGLREPSRIVPTREPYLLGLDADGEAFLDLDLPFYFRPSAVAVDGEGFVYVAGQSVDNEESLAALDREEEYREEGLLAKIDPGSREIVRMTILGGPGEDQVADIAVDSSGQVYAAGFTMNPEFPVSTELRVDGGSSLFVAAISADAGEVEWAALLGGSDAEWAGRIELTPTKELVVTSWTRSLDVPVLNAFRDEAADDRESFVAAFDVATKQHLYASYLGYWDLRGLASDESGGVYVSGVREIDGDRNQADVTRLDRTGKFMQEIVAGAPVLEAFGEAQLLAAGDGLSGVLDPSGLSGAQAAFVAHVSVEEPAESSPWLAAVLDAARNRATPLSSGMAVSIYGSGLGPVEGVGAIAQDSHLPTTLASVRVLINGEAAPLLFVSEGQINAMVPFGLELSELVSIEVEYEGAVSNAFLMSVAETAPQMFTRQGGSAVALLNEDGTLNSPANPAAPGSVVTMWATGVGGFEPPLADGYVPPAGGPHGEASEEISVEFPNPTPAAEILYAGAAEGLAAGIVQVNFRLPAEMPASSETFIWLRARGRVNSATSLISVGP